MTIYISQGRYTAAAIKGMSTHPEDRSEAVSELFTAAGCKLIGWYMTLGKYDWLIIAEAPDETTMISAVLAAAGGGSLTDTTTTVAMTSRESVECFRRAGTLAQKFRSAGQADYYGVGVANRREAAEP
ncbi:MAG TPA: GYD domain-containing protein [Vineibacter sp.]|nr:GYD domain-containing protein [Vineibacter sp.]